MALDDEAAAIRELATYERENVPSPAPPMPVRIDSGWWGVAAYLVAIWSILALMRRRRLAGTGAASADCTLAAVLDGECGD